MAKKWQKCKDLTPPPFFIVDLCTSTGFETNLHIDVEGKKVFIKVSRVAIVLKAEAVDGNVNN